MKKRVTVIFMLVLFIQAYPVGMFAQRSRVETENIVAAATADAKADARKETAGNIWFSFGFFLPCIGVGAAYLANIPLKEEKLLGKSPEYVETYTMVYKEEAHKIRVQNATMGCVAGSIIGLVTYGCYQQTKDHECFESFWSCDW